jgi:hypothetical protein
MKAAGKYMPPVCCAALSGQVMFRQPLKKTVLQAGPDPDRDCISL